MSPDERITKAVLQMLNGTADEKTVDDLATLVCNYDGFDPTRERARGVIRRLISAFISAPPEALRTDDLKKAIGAILLKVVQGDHGYETPDGFRRWGRIQADINAEIDKTFAVSPLARRQEKTDG